MRLIFICLALCWLTEAAGGDKSFPVRSCFASSVPAVSSGQMLIQTHLYLVCVDVEAKQAVWIAFHVSRSDWETDNVLERNFSTPADLRAVCLEQSDYLGSGYDLGHLYGLQHVSANRYASEVNQLQAIIAQRPALNRGPWLAAENRVHELSKAGTVAVMAGQLFESSMPRLSRAEESHKVGSHCWMIAGDGVNEFAYVMPQTCLISDDLLKFAIDPATLRKRINPVWWNGVP